MFEFTFVSIYDILKFRDGIKLMDRIEINNFDIQLNKDSVLSALGCFSGSGIYDTVSIYFDELLERVMSVLSPCAVIKFEDMRVYCAMTLGDGISEYSKSLFDAGEGMKGMLCDAMADEYLFAMDGAAADIVKKECALLGRGVKKRLEAPVDLPLAEQKIILEKTDIDGVGVTSGFMLEPVKSMCYILELTGDERIFNAQHDCSKCNNTDCPRRSTAEGSFKILSSYDYSPSVCGSAVCIDIGTTTVAFEYIRGEKTERTYKIINPQRRFGLDVLSRIEASNRGRSGELASLIWFALINGYREVTKGFGDADIIVIAGNTTMVHLLTDQSCETLGKYPFKSDMLNTLHTTFDELTKGGSVPNIKTIVFGGISAFVGGDIVSGMYMCDFDRSDKVNIFIDLGTNGEIAIGGAKKVLVTSTAAGPAFEGGRISCGTGSVEGAVCGVDIKDNTIRTIGNKPPIGLCGTGIIELVSELLDAGIIDTSGLLCEDFFTNGYRVAQDIVFTQEDIRQVQMAKAAVRAGIEVLAREYGINLCDIDTVYLAGGFGYGLSAEKACNIGILPEEFLGKIKIIGNSALGGCAKYCSLTDGDERTEHIKSISEEISLGNACGFEELYIKYMNF